MKKRRRPNHRLSITSEINQSGCRQALREFGLSFRLEINAWVCLVRSAADAIRRGCSRNCNLKLKIVMCWSAGWRKQEEVFHKETQCFLPLATGSGRDSIMVHSLHKQSWRSQVSGIVFDLFPLCVLLTTDHHLQTTQSDKSTLNEPLQTSSLFLQPEAVFYLALGNPQTSQLKVMEPDHFNRRETQHIQTKITCVSYNMATSSVGRSIHIFDLDTCDRVS